MKELGQEPKVNASVKMSPYDKVIKPFKQLQSVFSSSLEHNKQILKGDMSCKYENACASFLMAGTVGINTIQILERID